MLLFDCLSFVWLDNYGLANKMDHLKSDTTTIDLMHAQILIYVDKGISIIFEELYLILSRNDAGFRRKLSPI